MLVSEPSAHVFAARATLFLGDDAAMYDLHQRAADVARSIGALGSLTQILPRLAHAEIWAGRLAAAVASVHEGLALSRGIGEYDLVAQMLRPAGPGRSPARRGRGMPRVRGGRSGAGVGPADSQFTVACSHWALVQLELGLGRPAEAFRSAREIAGTLSLFWSGPDRIEAAVRVGEHETARAWLEAFEPWARHSAAAWALAGIAHCRALMAPTSVQAKQFFDEALERTRRDAGRSSAHARSSPSASICAAPDAGVEAREHLHAALDGFESLGAAVWAERARAELRASGQTTRKRDPSTRDELTPQELQIAGFVAEGFTNREVAAQLFVSPADDRLPPAQRLPEARDHDPHRARPPRPGRDAGSRGRGKPGDFAGASLGRPP